MDAATLHAASGGGDQVPQRAQLGATRGPAERDLVAGYDQLVARIRLCQAAASAGDERRPSSVKLAGWNVATVSGSPSRSSAFQTRSIQDLTTASGVGMAQV